MLVAVAALAAVPVFQIFRRLRRPREPRVHDYTEDRFFGITWRWRDVERAPSSLVPFCPTCDTVLVYRENYDRGGFETVLHCETCRADLQHVDGEFRYLEQKVRRQIDRKMRSGEWMQAIASPKPDVARRG